jgi:predicted transposase YdaD
VSKPFDASPKMLLEFGPADWAAFVGVKAQSVTIQDADVSTVTAAADKVLRVRTREGERIQHFDFQAGPDATLPRRVHRYNALLEVRHELPVESIVVLLARKANLRAINGNYESRLPGEARPYLGFRYRVVRVWTLPVEQVLSAGLSVLPLAPISDVAQDRLPKVIEQMEERFAVLDDRARVGELWTATKILMGTRYDKVFTDELLRGVRSMKESVTYQAIVEEGTLKEALRFLLRVGLERFKTPPSPKQMQKLEAIQDANALEDLTGPLLRVNNWDEFLNTPEFPRPQKPKKS